MPKITELAAVPGGSVLPGDLLALVQNGVTYRATRTQLVGPGVGGVGVKRFLAASNAPQFQKDRADYLCTGTNDHTVMHTAMAEMPSGGTVELSSGQFNVGTVVLKNRITLQGQGEQATLIRLQNSTNAPVIINYVSSNGVEANAQFTHVRDLSINGNYAAQTGTNCHGVKYDCNPQWTKASGDDIFDSHQMLTNVWIIDCRNNGVTSDGRGEHVYIGVKSWYCNGYGFLCPTDSRLVACMSGFSGLAGFYIPSPTSSLVGCKAFYAGSVTPQSGHGFVVPSGFASGAPDLTGCQAQDNCGYGFLIQSPARVNGVADSNNKWILEARATGPASANGQFAGVGLQANYSLIDVICNERQNNNADNWQIYGLHFMGGTGNTVNITHYAVGGASVGAGMKPGSSATTNNRVFINAVQVQEGAIMAGKSDFLENELLDHVLNASAYTSPTNIHVGLYTAAPTDAGGGTEVSGGSYARVQKTANTTNFPVASGGSIANGTAVTFPAATASWGVVTHFGLFDASTAGNLLYWGALTASKTVDNGDTVSFAIGALTVTED